MLWQALSFSSPDQNRVTAPASVRETVQVSSRCAAAVKLAERLVPKAAETQKVPTPTPTPALKPFTPRSMRLCRFHPR